MRLRVAVCLVAFLAFSCGEAFAQDTPKLDVFAGYSYFQANPGVSGADSFHLQGASASIAYNANNWLSGVADFGGYHAGNILGTGIDTTLSTYLFGPRVSYRHAGRFTPFAQALFGAAHASASAFGATGSENAFAMALGGGVDYGLTHHFAIRPFQVDYLLTRFNDTGTGAQNQNNFRISTGIVFRF